MQEKWKETQHIDCHKALDSAKLCQNFKDLEMYKILSVVVNLLKYNSELWKMTLYHNHAKGTATSDRLNIGREIFQGDIILLLVSEISFSHELNLIIMNTK